MFRGSNLCQTKHKQRQWQHSYCKPSHFLLLTSRMLAPPVAHVGATPRVPESSKGRKSCTIIDRDDRQVEGKPCHPAVFIRTNERRRMGVRGTRATPGAKVSGFQWIMSGSTRHGTPALTADLQLEASDGFRESRWFQVRINCWLFSWQLSDRGRITPNR